MSRNNTPTLIHTVRRLLNLFMKKSLSTTLGFIILRTDIRGGGGSVHIFMFCPTSRFQINRFEHDLKRKSLGRTRIKCKRFVYRMLTFEWVREIMPDEIPL